MSESLNHPAVLEAPAAGRLANVPSPVRASLFGRLRQGLTALVVFAALGALLAWGHLANWTLPTFSSLLGNAPDGQDDWCSEHDVPESECVECNPDLMPRPRSYGWCKRHGVHECPLEHPDVAQLATLPQVTADDLARAQRALDFTERPENNSKCKSHERRIQIASLEAVDRAGIEVEPVWKAPVVEFITANGEITYDQTQTASLSARVPGSVFQVYKRAGDPVKNGEVLAVVDAAEVGKAKAEFLHALASLDLKQQMASHSRQAYDRGALPQADLAQAETAQREAQIRLQTAEQALVNLGLPIRGQDVKGDQSVEVGGRLQFMGLPAPLARTFDPKMTTANLLPIVAPLDGIVVTRQAVAGEFVDNSKALFVVVDVRQMWLTLDLRVEDANRVALGQDVHFRPDGGEEARGTITWISTAADQKTRTVKVRASLGNSEGRLRANTFGSGKVVLRKESQAVVVPNEAVHWEGDCFVVFVRDKNFLKPGAPKVFHTRTVRPGARDDKQTEIIAGVLPGELVATRGSATLRAELLRGSLGEG